MSDLKELRSQIEFTVHCCGSAIHPEAKMSKDKLTGLRWMCPKCRRDVSVNRDKLKAVNLMVFSATSDVPLKILQMALTEQRWEVARKRKY